MASEQRNLSRKMAAIVHADVAGSTALVQLDETLAHERINQAFSRLSQSIEHYGGTVHEIRGDALVAQFPRASDAVCAALAFQGLHNQILAESKDEIVPSVRIGVSLGEAIFADGQVTGAGVVLAQRVEQLAEPGGMCITGAIHEAIPQHMPFVQTSMGEQEVKGFEEAIRVYRVALKPGEATPLPEKVPNPRATNTLGVSAAVTAIILVIAGSVAYWFQPWIPEEKPDSVEPMAFPVPDKPSIAVLPFANVSGEAEEEYFANGMTDDLITDLSKVSGLFVIARNSVFTYKGKPVKVQQVAKDLGVRYVLEGSVRRTGGRIRINAQLIDAANGHHMWAERYDRDYKDIFTIQNEVIEKIVSELAVKLSDREETRVAKIPTDNLEAYDYYLRAEQEGFYVASADSLHRALTFYKKAIELDPLFADAHAGYARTNAQIWRFGYDLVAAQAVARKRAYEVASRALAIDSENPRAYTVLATLQLVDGRHEEAIESAQRAIRSRPNDAEAHLHLGLVLAYSGQHKTAVTAVEKALRLNPKPSIGTLLFSGIVFYSDHQYSRAIQALKPALELAPDHEEPYLVAAYAQSGQLDHAASELDRLLRVFPLANLTYHRVLFQYYKHDEDLEHLIDGLREAGMPEWPLGLKRSEEDRLNANAIRDISLGQTWTGKHAITGTPFIQEIGETGTIAYRSAHSFLTGDIKIEQNMLCQSFQGYLSERKLCGYVYRNPTGAVETQDEYLYITADAAKYFSLVK